MAYGCELCVDVFAIDCGVVPVGEVGMEILDAHVIVRIWL